MTISQNLLTSPNISLFLIASEHGTHGGHDMVTTSSRLGPDVGEAKAPVGNGRTCKSPTLNETPQNIELQKACDLYDIVWYAILTSIIIHAMYIYIYIYVICIYIYIYDMYIYMICIYKYDMYIYIWYVYIYIYDMYIYMICIYIYDMYIYIWSRAPLGPTFSYLHWYLLF